MHEYLSGCSRNESVRCLPCSTVLGALVENVEWVRDLSTAKFGSVTCSKVHLMPFFLFSAFFVLGIVALLTFFSYGTELRGGNDPCGDEWGPQSGMRDVQRAVQQQRPVAKRSMSALELPDMQDMQQQRIHVPRVHDDTRPSLLQLQLVPSWRIRKQHVWGDTKPGVHAVQSLWGGGVRKHAMQRGPRRHLQSV